MSVTRGSSRGVMWELNDWLSHSFQVVEVVQHELSPLMLWTLTTNADERNARSLVSAYRADWTEMQIHAWLAENYPRGLTAIGLREIDETLLDAVA